MGDCIRPERCGDGRDRYPQGCRGDACRDLHRINMAKFRSGGRVRGKPPPACDIPECHGPLYARGMCIRCYGRWVKGGKKPIMLFKKWPSPEPGDEYARYTGGDQ